MSSKTIEDVAQIAGCSVGTVSRAINNRKGVGEKTRQRIFQIMEEIGYQPNAIAQSLTQKQTHSIGVIIPDISHNFLGKVALAIEEELARKQYDMLLFNTGWNPETEREKILLAQAKRVDGIILKPAVDSVNFMQSIHTPTVLVSQTSLSHTSFSDASCVDIDNIAAGYLAAEHCIKCGYRRIAFLGGLPVTSMIQQRYEGHCRALREFGIPMNEKLVSYSQYTIDDGYEKTKELMSQAEHPDAVCCSSDASALGVYKCVLELGLSVPQDVGIVGFNNDEIAGLPQVQLTTIDQPRRQIGQLAAQMIVNEIENKDTWQAQKVILGPKLIVRGTTK